MPKKKNILYTSKKIQTRYFIVLTPLKGSRVKTMAHGPLYFSTRLCVSPILSLFTDKLKNDIFETWHNLVAY